MRQIRIGLLMFFMQLSLPAMADVNLRTSPLSMLIGLWNVRADMALNENWMAGAQLSYFNRALGGMDQKNQGVGVTATYYPQGVFMDGTYFDVELATSWQKAATQDRQGREVSTDFNNHSLRALVGYHWFWLPFNLSVGAGVNFNSARSIKLYDTSGSEVDHVDIKGTSLALEFTVGTVF